MCNPMAIGGVVQAGAQMAAGAARNHHETRELKRLAKIERARGREAEHAVRLRTAGDLARRRVALLKGGVTGEGSPTDSLTDLAGKGDSEARQARFDHAEAAAVAEREARYRRRRQVLDQLSGAAAIGQDLIHLQ